ncbi:hypothetical protein XENTR_v10001604 [Xenopus tropicalis]|nr:hypothetical protein XENTR_v10001604 [Xenopus tropicalis]KAE8632627.1 hypothetical protein XENTR_v10001604 [Xenopus tropicalis]KAE8632628.1 hypothetical protein XENTR_v10001604 [Xenopus tropicalis]
MASQRITRDTLDAEVQKKMKRYRMSFNQALSDTLRECQLEGASKSKLPMDNYDALYRDRERYSLRDALDRSWDREDIASQSYLRDYGRDSSPGRLNEPCLDRWRQGDSISRERVYREELSSDRRLQDLEALRAREHSEFLSRDLGYGSRRWEPERNQLRVAEYNLPRPAGYRDLNSELNRFEQRGNYSGLMQSAFKSPGNKGKGPAKQTRGGKVQRSPAGRGQAFRQGPEKGGQSAQESRFISGKKEAAATQPVGGELSKNPSAFVNAEDQSAALKHGLQMIRWSKFNTMENDNDLIKQHKALFKVETDACNKIVECFKYSMLKSQREQCFNAVKFLSHPALKNPKIDNELLDLLMASHTVQNLNDFFEVIKPFDKEMLIIQQRLLKCAIPLLIACNTFELKHSILTDQRQVLGALKNTVFLCRKSMVLLGQTFTMATAARQSNILNVLGLSDFQLKASDFPNVKDSFLFGKDFLRELKIWLKDNDRKPVLKARILPAEEGKDEPQPSVEEEIKDEKVADPEVVATIDKLLENAKNGYPADGEKPVFWFLFDKDSSEYKYYRQKLAQFQKSKGETQEAKIQTKKLKKAPAKTTNEAIRAMLYAKKALAVRKRINKSLAYSRKQRLRKASVKPSTCEPVKLVPKSEPKEEVSEAKPEIEELKKAESKPITDTTETTIEPPKVKEEKEEEVTECVKQKSSSDQEELDDKTKDTAVKLAQFVAQMGPELEQFSMENSINNPEFWFLREKNSPAYKFYQSKVEEFKLAEEKAANDDKEDDDDDDDDDDDFNLLEDDGELENIRTGDAEDSDEVEMDAECEAAEAPSVESPLVAAFTPMPTPAMPPLRRKRVTKLKVGMLPAKRVCLVEEPQVHDPIRIEYERPRGRGYNRNKKPSDLEFANKKLTEGNVGFQMLSKMGWKEGQGLGTSGSGIKNPVKVYVAISVIFIYLIENVKVLNS